MSWGGRRFTSAELRRYFLALDSFLTKGDDLKIIGGAAAALAHGATRLTKDIDLWGTPPQAIRDAFQRASLKSGLDIPIDPAGVAEGPTGLETRWKQLPRGGRRHLRIFVPERHDLVLMKTIRAYGGDLEVMQQMHESRPLLKQQLIHRFERELIMRRPGEEDATFVAKDARILRLQFTAVLERLFGKKVAREYAAKHGLPSS